MWHKPSPAYPARKYMNYAAFRNKLIIDSFVRGFLTRPRHDWASARMYKIGSYQLALFLAYCSVADEKQRQAFDLITEYRLQLPQECPTDPINHQLKRIYDGLVELVLEDYEKNNSALFGLSSTFSSTHKGGVSGYKKVSEINQNKNDVSAITPIKTTIYSVHHSSFCDEIFPETLRSRPDFKEIRARGWMEAIKERPSYRLALPLDLTHEWNEQSLSSKHTNSALLEKWIAKLEKSPWYLDASNTVPVSIRHHDHILNAYVVGWSKIIQEVPWRISAFSTHNCMNHAAFRNKLIIDSIIKGLQMHYNEQKASSRMFEMGAYQLAIFLAYGLLGDDKQGEATFFINRYNMSLPKGFPSDPMLQQLKRIYDGQIESVIEAYTGDSVLTTFGLSSTFG